MRETVCCAGICIDTGQFLRLYPIPYRQLSKEQRFNRYDIIEVSCARNTSDHRPESYKVNPDSIKILTAAKASEQESKHRLWLPHVSASLEALRAENQITKRSLGIIKPDEGSIRFIMNKLSDEQMAEREAIQSVYQQSLLFNDNATSPLPSPQYSFKYRYTSAGKSSEMTLHDWEVQAAYWNFTRQYGHSEGLDKLRYKYQTELPERNLHIILGTMKAHPHQFIAIGLLRPKNLEAIQSQPTLF